VRALRSAAAAAVSADVSQSNADVGVGRGALEHTVGGEPIRRERRGHARRVGVSAKASRSYAGTEVGRGVPGAISPWSRYCADAEVSRSALEDQSMGADASVSRGGLDHQRMGSDSSAYADIASRTEPVR
jgi:hypothetical protein